MEGILLTHVLTGCKPVVLVGSVYKTGPKIQAVLKILRKCGIPLLAKHNVYFHNTNYQYKSHVMLTPLLLSLSLYTTSPVFIHYLFPIVSTLSFFFQRLLSYCHCNSGLPEEVSRLKPAKEREKVCSFSSRKPARNVECC